MGGKAWTPSICWRRLHLNIHWILFIAVITTVIQFLVSQEVPYLPLADLKVAHLCVPKPFPYHPSLVCKFSEQRSFRPKQKHTTQITWYVLVKRTGQGSKLNDRHNNMSSKDNKVSRERIMKCVADDNCLKIRSYLNGKDNASFPILVNSLHQFMHDPRHLFTHPVEHS